MAEKKRPTQQKPPASSDAVKFATLAKILKDPPVRTQDEGGITCDLCKDENWWYEQYGGGWEAYHWWYCGPLGLDCDSGTP